LQFGLDFDKGVSPIKTFGRCCAIKFVVKAVINGGYFWPFGEEGEGSEVSIIPYRLGSLGGKREREGSKYGT